MNRSEVTEFLRTRRARISPQDAGLPAFGGNRRVPGLRREEVAMLAGVSVDYYVRLERGNLAGASDSVLDALANALRLDDAERAHLFDLARAAGPGSSRASARPPAGVVRPQIQAILDSISAPAWVRNGRLDHLAHNRASQALYAPLLDSPERPTNTARYVFLDESSRDFFVDWHQAAADVTALLRMEAGKRPRDKALTQLVGELSTRSDEFRALWARHDVKFHRSGAKRLRHPAVGVMELEFEGMELPSDPDLTLLVYAVTAGTPVADQLELLQHWADEREAAGLLSDVSATRR
ncbi:helix-turn-helix transcriptional regulator [Demequina capsici]|uniref:Helix-turn-helix transcriptional regulator n=1 Tax=Demequina capsici TaxID=3075620 RepID=A0AA96JDV7_9MICO|nr:helix-turn-helix transcriptional regulator [Demequina sp. PMTSA13]WNM28501.1 helix-turn-helix transcriptional regulator [Demequina sp. PMTSA13]